MKLFLYEYGPGFGEGPIAPIQGTFEMKTCQRTLLLNPRALPLHSARHQFEGWSAYEFLLRFACGLESEIKGETDVFGQIKIAVRSFAKANPTGLAALQPIFLKLFEDTKDIRSNYLHGIGGNTYGALARRLLNPLPHEKVLILGAGQISKSVAPYFADSNLSVFNRSLGRLLELTSELAKKGYTKIRFLQDDHSLDQSLNEADLIILGTPAKSELDDKVLDACSRENQKARILHLGAQAPELEHFSSLNSSAPRFSSLSDLFSMEKEQNIFRERQVSQAIEACRHRALLRSLDRSIRIAHGWEDLALFY